jgi:peptidoglycan/LPS O-acetylase OafA/YrhL
VVPLPSEHPTARRVGLDGLRGIAALSVLSFHVWLYARPNPPATNVTGAIDWTWSCLRWGLVLFFVLTGFLLYRPWLDARKKGTSPRLETYVRRRAARILPAYYLALVGSIALRWGAGGVPGVRLPSAATLPTFFVFAQNFSDQSLLTLDPPMWTLAVEVTFYLLLPVFGFLALRRRDWPKTAVPALLLAVGLAWSWGVAALGGSLPLTKILPEMLPFFAAGMLAAALVHDRVVSARGARLLLAGAIAGLAVQVVTQLLAPSVAGTVLHELPLAAAFAAIVTLGASDRCPSWLCWRPLTAVGTVSYGVYLWNVPVLWALRSDNLLPLSPPTALPVVAVASLGIATLSWMLVEKPVMAWSRRREPRARIRAPLIPAPAVGNPVDR